MRHHRSRRRHVARTSRLNTGRQRLPIRRSPKPPLRRPTMGAGPGWGSRPPRRPIQHRSDADRLGPAHESADPQRPVAGTVALAADTHSARSPTRRISDQWRSQLVTAAPNIAPEQRRLEPDNRALSARLSCVSHRRHGYRSTVLAPVGAVRDSPQLSRSASCAIRHDLRASIVVGSHPTDLRERPRRERRHADRCAAADSPGQGCQAQTGSAAVPRPGDRQPYGSRPMRRSRRRRDRARRVDRASAERTAGQHPGASQHRAAPTPLQNHAMRSREHDAR